MFPVVILLDHETADKIGKPVRGKGGFQDLLRLLQRHRKGESIVVPSREVGEKIVRYCSEYGPGGFEGRLKEIGDRLRDQLGD